MENEPDLLIRLLILVLIRRHYIHLICIFDPVDFQMVKGNVVVIVEEKEEEEE